MKQNWEEQKIRQLFNDARQADEQHAPRFAGLLAAAQSRAKHSGWRLNIWRIAFASVALITIGVAAFVIFMRSSRQPDQEMAGHLRTLELPPVKVDSPEIPALVNPEVARGIAIKESPMRQPGARRRSHATKPQQNIEPTALLSLKWQSPTDFLLRTPGTDLLKSTPRLRDSLIRLDVIPADEKN